MEHLLVWAALQDATPIRVAAKKAGNRGCHGEDGTDTSECEFAALQGSSAFHPPPKKQMASLSSRSLLVPPHSYPLSPFPAFLHCISSSFHSCVATRKGSPAVPCSSL